VSARGSAATRFAVDPLHPGWVTESWQDWFLGPRGSRRLALAAAAGAALLALVLVALVVPGQRRVTADRDALPALHQELAARNAELGLLRSSLDALAQEARRQVRWADLLTALGREMPPSLRLQLLEIGRAQPAPGQAQGPAARGEEILRIEALTPSRAGSPALEDVAQLMGSLMRDPAVSRRFAVKSWEIKPSALATPAGEALLSISIVLAETTP
jgi:hypothetical protein